LAIALTQLGAHSDAQAAAERAIGLRPGYAEAHVAHAEALHAQGKLDEAITTLSTLMDARPSAQVLGRIAGVTSETGRVDDAIDLYRQAVAMDPTDSNVHSNFLYTLHYQDGVTGEQLLAEHLAWAERHAEPLYKTIRPHEIDRTPGRRLRIGYVSADFRQHSVATFLEPLVTGHDHERFEVYCYSDVGRPDAVTRRFQVAVDLWRTIRGMTDEAVAELIRRDRIDILVDPAGHMGPNRPLLFARKPAPVQIAFPGYPGTSGLKTMDYFVTDEHQDPPGQTEHHYVEGLMRLPVCRCYRPPDDCPEPGPPPCLANGYVTFGSVNRVEKITPRMMRLWAEILGAVPKSRMLILTGHGDDAQADRQFRPNFAKHGLVGTHVEFIGRLSQPDYFRLFHRLDVVLDTFPYNGCTTTYDALWMGVPVVTLFGARYSARVGGSILSALGMSGEPLAIVRAYHQTAVEMALGRQRSARIRRGHLVSTDRERAVEPFEQELQQAWQSLSQSS
jgi:predicted O-linked N-acetylglucosamine transferase (SPINDLY family)